MMTRYRLQGFENADGLGDVPLGETTVECGDRQQAVLLGIAHFTGNPVGACLRRRIWIEVDELWGETPVDAIQLSLLVTLREGPLTTAELIERTRRLPRHAADALRQLESKGLVRRLPDDRFQLEGTP